MPLIGDDIVSAMSFLAWQSIKFRKRISLMIGIAIVISTMFLIFLGFGGTSTFYMIDQNNRDQYGDQMLVVTGFDDEMEKRIQKDHNMNVVGKFQISGTVASKRGNIPMQVGCADKSAIKTAHISIKEGHFPNSPDEVAFEQIALYRLGLYDMIKIGDYITFEEESLSGKLEKKTLKLSGILENYSLSWFKNYQSVNQNADNIIFTPPSIFVFPQNLEARNILLLDTSHTTSSNVMKTIGEKNFLALNITVYPQIETMFLTLPAGFRYNAIIDWMVIGGIIIAVAAIGIILNAFLMSMDRRREQIALLRTIGGSSAQTQCMIFLEALLIWIIAMPIGIIMGIILSFGIVKLFAIFTGLNLRYYFWLPTLVIVVIVSFFTILFSVLLPMRRVAKISPISVTQYKFFCKPRFKRIGRNNLSPFILSLTFIRQGGFRIAITIISLVICFVMLNLMNLFSNVWSKSTSNLREADYRIVTKSTAKDSDNLAFIPIKDDFVKPQPIGLDEQLCKVLNPEGVITQIDPFFYLELHKDKVDSYWSGFPQHRLIGSVLISGGNLTRDKYGITDMVDLLHPKILTADSHALDLMKKDIANGQINNMAIQSGKEIVIVLPDYVKYTIGSDEKIIVGNLTEKPDDVSIISESHLKIGDEINFVSIIKSSRKADAIIVRQSAKVGAIIRSSSFLEYQDEISVIIGNKVLTNWGFTGNIIQTDVYLSNTADIEDMEEKVQQIVDSTDNVQLYSRMESMKQEQQEHRVQTTVVYMIAILVAALGILGIYNVIACRIYNRRREIAMLRAVGMTKQQILQVILFEGVLYGLVTIVVSISVFLSFIGLAPLPFAYSFSFISYPILIGTILGTILLCVTVTFLPARKVMKSVVAEDIKEPD